ncbi:MAG: Txe/YoeB family addiction module toxin [Verrucomicrobiaceae bacterium]|jgi:Txe/YoeB family toxin of toxin-antitoxin system|nr:MAG: Txe/YoeB family addiction module toxin [Verrucomicrobiaceae bacterium]RPJ35229.1 MAG: Txe/YoeB family addiction module toxin [Verrucomicrobiaceae bacterium]
MYEIVYSRQAGKDAKKLAASHLKKQAQTLLDIIASDPFQSPPRYESLCGELSGCFSRRINLLHRIVYEVFIEQKKVLILRMWTHYGD